MAQLRDTLIQGSARVTDTLYANNININDIITAKGLVISSEAAEEHIKFNRNSINYILFPNNTTSSVAIGYGAGTAYCPLIVQKSSVFPGGTTETINFGLSSNRWNTIYGKTGNFSDTITVASSITAGTSTAGGHHGQLALYSTGTKGTYLDAAANSTDWYTATLQAKTGTIALTSDIPTNLNQLTNGPGYVTSSGVTSITLSAGAGISLSATGAITSTGTRTISISGVDTTNGSETQCLTKKGTWKSFGTSNLALGSTAGAALAASGSAGSATTAAKSDHVHPFPTAANVGAATDDHVHGNITNAGGITSDALTIANNDFIVIGDSSDSGKLHKGPAFNASTTTKCLTQKGTWASFTNNAGTVTSITLTAGAGIALDATGAITSSGTRTISIDGMDESSGSTTKCLTQKGTWASFTNNAGTVTSITLSAGAGIALSATGAITTSGTRTISISGMDTSSGSTTKCLTEKGTWALFTNNAGTVTSITLKAGDNITLDTDNTAITNSGTRTISLSKIQTPLTAASSTAAVTTSPYKSALWTFDLGVSSANLVNGMIITVQIPVATTSYGAYVSVDNGSTYKPVVVSNSTARLTTHYNVNDVVTLFYDADGSCVTYALAGAANTSTITGGCWRVLSSYDSGNSNDTAGYMRQMQNGAYRKTSTALYRYKILLPHKDGIHIIPANTSDIRNNTDYPISTAMTTITTAEFDITRPIEYYSTTTNLAADANIDGRYHWFMYSGIDLRYSFNTGATLTAGKDVYLVAIVQAGGLTAKLRNPGATGTNAAATATGANAGPITQTLPTSDDGFIYIKLGNAYGTTGIVLTPDHPIYYYKDGSVQPFTPTGISPSGTATKFLNQQGEWTTVSTSDTKVTQAYSTTNNSYPLLFSATAGITSTSSRGATTAIVNNAIYANPSTGHLYATAVHNAVWNDYAEYRKAADNPEPGRVVIDNDNGTMTVVTQRLIPGAQVISDTWGHVMGETDDAKTPIAVAGRVLVYTFQSRKNYHAGMAVCSAPNGTVDIMTREEIRDYPDCIIGIVSEIPNYEEWGSGHVKVNGRIWIKVK